MCCKLVLVPSQFSFSRMAWLAWQQIGGMGFVDGYQSIRSLLNHEVMALAVALVRAGLE